MLVKGREYVEIFYIKHKFKEELHTVPKKNRLFSTREQAEEYLDRFTNNNEYVVLSKLIDARCRCDDYNQTTMVIYILTEDGIHIQFMGNLISLHERIQGLFWDEDVVSWIHMCTSEYFKKHFKIEER